MKKFFAVLLLALFLNVAFVPFSFSEEVPTSNEIDAAGEEPTAEGETPCCPLK